MEEKLDKLYQRLKRDAEAGGYHLNPDLEFVEDLLAGLQKNQERYGYMSCPCRLASGKKTDDLDIICPCDYRDPDLKEHEMCYCGLYVSGKILSGDEDIHPIPERRSPNRCKREPAPEVIGKLSLPVYRCKVCGYLCAREHPPEVCPICKVSAERFERFI